MKDIKLTIYDWLGYLIPGSILLLTFYLVSGDLINKLLSFSSSNFVDGFVGFCIAYGLGHLLHAVANVTIDKLPSGDYPPGDYFINDFNKDFSLAHRKSLIKILTEKFDLKDGVEEIELIKKSYWLCFANVIEKNENSLVQTYLNLNGFCRGMTISCFLSFIILLKSTLVFTFSILAFLFVPFIFHHNLYHLFHHAHYNGLIGLIFLVSSLLFFFRAKRFKRYLTRCVYTEFISINSEGNKKQSGISSIIKKFMKDE